MYGWSKYGGGNKGLVTSHTGTWFCQSCSEEQVDELPGYMLPFNDREFGRVCSRCYHEAVKQEVKDLLTLRDLFKPKELWEG